MTPTSQIEIDLTSISQNVKIFRSMLAARADGGGKVGLCAVVKADAYGLGAPRIAKRLAMAGVDLFAVYTPDEARALVEGAIMTPILMMMPVRGVERNDLLYRAATRGQLQFAVHDPDGLRGLMETTDRQGIILPLQVEVDTGMSRGGAPPDEALAMIESIVRHPRLRLVGVFNHLSSAGSNDALSEKQATRFDEFLDQAADLLPTGCIVHEANTMGTLRASRHHRSMVRVGIGLLGLTNRDPSPDTDRDPALEHELAANELRPCFRWTSHVVRTKWITRGTPVGYEAQFKARKKTRLGLVPVGYADGYPLALSGQSQVGIELPDGDRAYVPILGRISMDQLVIDLTELPEGPIGVGTQVEIMGVESDSPTHPSALAKLASTTTHEILCRLSPRVKRTYRAVDHSDKSRPMVTTARHPALRAVAAAV